MEDAQPARGRARRIAADALEQAVAAAVARAGEARASAHAAAAPKPITLVGGGFVRLRLERPDAGQPDEQDGR